MQAFFKLHSGLKREGPGARADLDAALRQIDVPQNARIMDAGCGPGDDIDGLLSFAPKGHVTAVDGHQGFVDQINARWGDDPRVSALAGNMLDQSGPFDLIWSAGALYFLGIETALAEMLTRLKPGGALVFSEMVFLTETPDEALSRQIVDVYPDLTHISELERRIVAAGYTLISATPLSDQAWEDYFGPIDERVALLRRGADAALTAVLDEAEAEAALWRKYKRQFGYALCVAVKPA